MDARLQIFAVLCCKGVCERRTIKRLARKSAEKGVDHDTKRAL
jgi:hypothetical protein